MEVRKSRYGALAHALLEISDEENLVYVFERKRYVCAYLEHSSWGQALRNFLKERKVPFVAIGYEQEDI